MGACIHANLPRTEKTNSRAGWNASGLGFLTPSAGYRNLASMEDSGEIAQKLANLLRQREVLREQADLIAEAFARTGDEIELLRAQARAAGLLQGEDAG